MNSVSLLILGNFATGAVKMDMCSTNTLFYFPSNYLIFIANLFRLTETLFTAGKK